MVNDGGVEVGPIEAAHHDASGGGVGVGGSADRGEERGGCGAHVGESGVGIGAGESASCGAARSDASDESGGRGGEAPLGVDGKGGDVGCVCGLVAQLDPCCFRAALCVFGVADDDVGDVSEAALFDIDVVANVLA